MAKPCTLKLEFKHEDMHIAMEFESDPSLFEYRGNFHIELRRLGNLLFQEGKRQLKNMKEGGN